MPKNENEIVISNYLINNAKEPLTIGTKVKLNVEKVMLDIEKYNNNVEFRNLVPVGEEKIEYTITGIIQQTNEELYSTNAYIAITKLSKTVDTRPSRITVLLHNPKETSEFYDMIANWNSHINVRENNELLLWQGSSTDINEKLQLELVASLIIFIITGITIALIRNSFQISIAERRKEFAMLITIGATLKQIKRIILLEGIFYVAISIPIGIVLGIGSMAIGINSINCILANMIVENYFTVQFSISAMPIIISTIFMTAMIFISCIKPIQEIKEISPIEAIRQNNEIVIRDEKIKINKFVEKNIGIEGQIAYKNLKRNKRMYRATTISICIIIILIFITNSAIEYIFGQTNSVYSHNYNIDIAPIYGTTSYFSQIELYERVKNLESINEYSIFANFNGTLRLNRDIPISVIACEGKVFNEYLQDLGLEYEKIISSGILIKPDSSKEMIKLKEGDILPIKVNGTQYNIPIVKITKDNPFWAVQTLDSSKIIKTDETKLVLTIEMAKNINFEDNGFSFSAGVGMRINSENPDELEKEISKFSNSKTTIVTNYKRQQENKQKMKFMVNICLYGLLIIISVIGIANIYNTMLESMNLRFREIKILQSIGMTKKQFNKMFFYESFIYTLKALVIGTIIGFIISYCIYLISVNYNSLLAYHIPIGQLILVGIIIFSIILIIIKKVKKNIDINERIV